MRVSERTLLPELQLWWICCSLVPMNNTTTTKIRSPFSSRGWRRLKNPPFCSSECDTERCFLSTGRHVSLSAMMSWKTRKSGSAFDDLTQRLQWPQPKASLHFEYPLCPAVTVAGICWGFSFVHTCLIQKSPLDPPPAVMGRRQDDTLNNWPFHRRST